MVFLVFSVFISCRKDVHVIKKENNKGDTLKDRTIKPEKSEIKNSRNQVRHYFVANGGSIIYLKNGDIKGLPRFDTDGDAITDLLNTETYGTYREMENYLIQGNDIRTDFFEDFGKIDSSWKILKGHSVENQMQVFSYTTPKNTRSENIETVDETCLIIFSPEYKTFKDENSEEADNYFIAMDDWNFYSLELNEEFEKIEVKTIYLKRPYVKLTIENNESIIINTKEKINNYKTQALLYKKGKRPLIIHLIYADNQLDDIKEYLK